MMKKNILLMTMMAGVLIFSSCASKKDLENCRLDNQSLQNENKELNTNYQVTKEQLAAANARVASLEDQLRQAKKDYGRLQSSLDKSLNNANQNNISIEKLVDQINESNQYIRHLTELKSKSDSLNLLLTNNLTRSLSKEELKEVDVQVLKGVVYISLFITGYPLSTPICSPSMVPSRSMTAEISSRLPTLTAVAPPSEWPIRPIFVISIELTIAMIVSCSASS